MIQAVNEMEQILTSNTDTVKFADTDLRTASANCQFGWLNYNEGSAQFNILGGGIYEIEFNANVTSATAGAIALGLFTDGVKLNGGEADTVITTAGDYHNVSIHKFIRVCGRGNVTVSINSLPTVVFGTTTTDTQIPTIKNANISIRRFA